MTEYDLYDVLAELGYGLNPRTRRERAQAFTYKHQSWPLSLPAPTRGTLEALAAQFARAGGLTALRALGKPAEVLRETKERLFAA